MSTTLMPIAPSYAPVWQMLLVESAGVLLRGVADGVWLEHRGRGAWCLDGAGAPDLGDPELPPGHGVVAVSGPMLWRGQGGQLWRRMAGGAQRVEGVSVDPEARLVQLDADTLLCQEAGGLLGSQRVRCLGLRDGEKRWTRKAQLPTLWAAGPDLVVLWAGASAGTLLGVDRASGRVRWRAPGGRSPTVVAHVRSHHWVVTVPKQLQALHDDKGVVHEAFGLHQIALSAATVADGTGVSAWAKSRIVQLRADPARSETAYFMPGTAPPRQPQLVAIDAHGVGLVRESRGRLLRCDPSLGEDPRRFARPMTVAWPGLGVPITTLVRRGEDLYVIARGRLVDEPAWLVCLRPTG